MADAIWIVSVRLSQSDRLWGFNLLNAHCKLECILQGFYPIFYGLNYFKYHPLNDTFLHQQSIQWANSSSRKEHITIGTDRNTHQA